jgi:hypothetical protein
MKRVFTAALMVGTTLTAATLTVPASAEGIVAL